MPSILFFFFFCCLMNIDKVCCLGIEHITGSILLQCLYMVQYQTISHIECHYGTRLHTNTLWYIQYGMVSIDMANLGSRSSYRSSCGSEWGNSNFRNAQRPNCRKGYYQLVNSGGRSHLETYGVQQILIGLKGENRNSVREELQPTTCFTVCLHFHPLHLLFFPSLSVSKEEALVGISSAWSMNILCL